MKKINFLLLFLVCIASYGQNDVLKDLQGLSSNGNQFYELAGVNIEVITQDIKFNEKGIKQIKKQSQIKKVIKEYKDSTLKRDNLVIESILKERNETANLICYIFPKNEQETSFILFRSQLPISSTFVNTFVSCYFDGQLSQFSGTLAEASDPIDSINFVGRTVIMGYGCRFMYVNNVQCGRSQMSWSIFDSEQSALANEKLRMEHGDSNPEAKPASGTGFDVNITFEGIKTKAKRSVYQIKSIANVITRTKQFVCVYYVNQEIRGRYVNVVFSYYMNNEEDFELPPLLKEFMSLD